MPIVVDTSVVLRWILAEVYSANANALRRDCLRGRDQIVAPTLLLYEATNTLYGAGRDGTAAWQSIEQGLDDILTVVRLRIPTADTAKRATEIARLTTQTYTWAIPLMHVSGGMDSASRGQRRAVGAASQTRGGRDVR